MRTQFPIFPITNGLGFVCLLFLTASSAYPQTRTNDASSALAQAEVVGPFVQEALENNAGIQAFEIRYEAARESIVSARALPNPRIQITHFIESIQTRTGPQRQAIQLMQPFPSFGSLSRRVDIARSHSEALWHAYAIQQFALIDQVATQALDLAYLEKSIEITKENVALLERLESIAEDRVKSGGNLEDLLRVQVEIERYLDSVAKQEALRLSTTYQLEGLMGRELNKGHFPIDWRAPPPIASDTAEWLNSIAERSPQLSMMKSLESSQEGRERLARIANRPELSVGINYIRTGEAMNPATVGSGQDPWAIMVGVSLPIWGKANNAIAAAASLEKEAIAAQIIDLERSLLAEGRTWIVKLEDAQNRLRRYEENLLPLARQAQEITESSYQAGKASALDLIDSDRALLNLETEYWRVAADAWLARWKLATLSGGLWLN